MDRSDREARAAVRRRTAVLNRTKLQRIEPDPVPVWGAAAISLVERLTHESWVAANREFPTYTRRQIPVRFVAGRIT